MYRGPRRTGGVLGCRAERGPGRVLPAGWCLTLCRRRRGTVSRQVFGAVNPGERWEMLGEVCVNELEQETEVATFLDPVEPDAVTPLSSDLQEAPHFTVSERVARGRAARAELPRSIHGGWEPAPLRRDPVELLEEQAQTRLPELIPIRYGRMLESAFAFYRGGAFLMAADLAAGPRTGLLAQLCGDAHLSNFGVFAAPDRRLVFSISDFDETLHGPFEWDVKRLAASFAVAGREFGYDEGIRRAMVMDSV